MKAILSLFIKRNQYQVMSLMAHSSVVNERLKEAQDNGWEICGDVLLKNEDGDCTRTFLHIPMKRKI